MPPSSCLQEVLLFVVSYRTTSTRLSEHWLVRKRQDQSSLAQQTMDTKELAAGSRDSNVHVWDMRCGSFAGDGLVALRPVLTLRVRILPPHLVLGRPAAGSTAKPASRQCFGAA